MLYSSTIPPGMLKNDWIDEDIFDECSSVVGVWNNGGYNNLEIRGQYCTFFADWRFENQTLSTNLRIPICVPLSCEAENVETLFYLIPGNHRGKFYDFQMSPDTIQCYPIKNRTNWDFGLILIW